MLGYLHLKNVGPAPEMDMELAPRLNIITGDNGLGKRFLLDVMWWALSRRWPREVNPRMTSGYMARPRELKQTATIDFELKGKAKKLVGNRWIALKRVLFHFPTLNAGHLSSRAS